MTQDKMDRAYHDGFSHGMHVGLAVGRFYEKHGYTERSIYNCFGRVYG